MRLLQINNDDDLSLVEYFGTDIPPYAILSHTWGADDEEISFKDVKKNRARSKPSAYRKVRFCGEIARRNGIFFFWVDTCCIKQESSQEVGEAINSMYRWYHDAVICYVYLTDVTVGTVTHEGIASVSDWSTAFRSSRWFTRGWTLQELLAPVSIEFYSKDGYRLGDRTTLVQQIQMSTDAPTFGPGEGQWNSLSFQHNEDYSSSLSLDGTHPTLRCQRRDSGWPEAMLPDIYHGPSTPYQQYGSLRGDLSIFLALMALSVKPDMLASLMPYLRHDAKWQCREDYPNGRLDKRGVVVYVYCGTEPGSTSEDLQAYEAGRYGNYFD
ncbi:hypothetical protein J4E85_005603 [Alternaria conjuncta]|uniref:uncharacterized protein n=1 Tax=Alternaria conjuncta TaxID=181017 RepID=UPI00221F1688|nr:uncharacterized protein J4E85_005603 [Alternaria conjuncta]KAI4928981.1 hypothetical protein J4E85_005603 [Alternaria conjuncta]